MLRSFGSFYGLLWGDLYFSRILGRSLCGGNIFAQYSTSYYFESWCLLSYELIFWRPPKLYSHIDSSLFMLFDSFSLYSANLLVKILSTFYCFALSRDMLVLLPMFSSFQGREFIVFILQLFMIVPLLLSRILLAVFILSQLYQQSVSRLSRRTFFFVNFWRDSIFLGMVMNFLSKFLINSFSQFYSLLVTDIVRMSQSQSLQFYFEYKNQNYKFYAYTVNCPMNIKSIHNNKKNTSTKQASRKHQSKSISPSSKKLTNKKCVKNQQNIKPPKYSQNITSHNRSPPAFRRQNTQFYNDGEICSKKVSHGDQRQKKNVLNDIKKMHCHKQNKKISSDQQSTNVYRYHKQSADQQHDPYKIISTNRFYKEKSIKPSRDLSITLMCNNWQKPTPNPKKITQNVTISKKKSLSIQDLKTQINKKIQSFKSLTKLHQRENEYFTKKVGISNEQQKRLQKIQLIEITSVKNHIFNLKDEIEHALVKQK